MTEFQKEIAGFVVLLAFFYGFFCCAGTAPTEKTGIIAKMAVNK